MTTLTEETPDGVTSGWILQRWAVCFLDILGQAEAFLKTDYLPESSNTEAMTQLVAEVQASLGTVHNFYRLSEQFAGVSSEFSGGSPLRELPPELQRTARKFTSRAVHHIPWSDGIVFYTSLRPDDEKHPLASLEQILVGAATLALQQLAAGKPIRGGIDIGTGIRAEGQLFGAAVVKAYRLESKRAGYPRILVGSDLVKHLDAMASTPRRSPEEKLIASMAGDLRRLLRRDSDAEWILDYLGEYASNLLGPLFEAGLADQAYAFVRTSREHWRPRDERLFERYSQLQRYFDASAAWQSRSARAT